MYIKSRLNKTLKYIVKSFKNFILYPRQVGRINLCIHMYVDFTESHYFFVLYLDLIFCKYTWDLSSSHVLNKKYCIHSHNVHTMSNSASYTAWHHHHHRYFASKKKRVRFLSHWFPFSQSVYSIQNSLSEQRARIWLRRRELA